MVMAGNKWDLSAGGFKRGTGGQFCTAEHLMPLLAIACCQYWARAVLTRQRDNVTDATPLLCACCKSVVKEIKVIWSACQHWCWLQQLSQPSTDKSGATLPFHHLALPRIPQH